MPYEVGVTSMRLREDPRSGESQILPDVDLCLVSCGECKSTHAAPAKCLYKSDRFQRTRQFVEERGWRWFILSAKHGLLDPERRISPYDETLCTNAERRKWTDRVFRALRPQLVGVRSVVIFADCQYSQYLATDLRKCGVKVCCLARDWVVVNFGPKRTSG